MQDVTPCELNNDSHNHLWLEKNKFTLSVKIKVFTAEVAYFYTAALQDDKKISLAEARKRAAGYLFQNGKIKV